MYFFRLLKAMAVFGKVRRGRVKEGRDVKSGRSQIFQTASAWRSGCHSVHNSADEYDHWELPSG